MTDNPASQQITIRFKPGDLQLFQKKAAEHGMSTATFVRVCALRGMRIDVVL